MGVCSSSPNEGKTEPIALKEDELGPRDFSTPPTRLDTRVESHSSGGHLQQHKREKNGQKQEQVETFQESVGPEAQTLQSEKIPPEALAAASKSDALVSKPEKVKPPGIEEHTEGGGVSTHISEGQVGTRNTGTEVATSTASNENAKQSKDKVANVDEVDRGKDGREDENHGESTIQPKSRKDKRRGSLFEFLVEEEKKGGTSKLVAELTDNSWKNKSTEGIDKAVEHDIFVIADDENGDDEIFDEVESGSDSESSADDSDDEYEEIKHDPKEMAAKMAQTRCSVDGG